MRFSGPEFIFIYYKHHNINFVSWNVLALQLSPLCGIDDDQVESNNVLKAINLLQKET